MEPVTINETPQTDAHDVVFVFYQPNLPPQRPQPDRRSTWEKLVDRIANTKSSRRLQVQSLIELLPCNSHETPISTASRLASRVSSDRNERKIQELLVMTLCSILYSSGRASPEELDSVIGKFSSSTSMKYLDRLRRAGNTANEIIIEWAESKTGDLLYRLDCATQAVLRAGLSLPQWGILNGNGRKVKERILSRPLPEVPQTNSAPILVPCVLDFLANGYISISEICCRLGYNKAELTDCIARVPRYKQTSAVRDSLQVCDAKMTEGSDVDLTKTQDELQERGG